jgi:tetratricopeptide (TPR) repeat protein
MAARRWRRRRTAAALLAAVPLALAAPDPAAAIMSGEASKLAPSGDPDYAAGKAAFEREDWTAAIASLTIVLASRPWHDNAHAMIAYAWRKLGDTGLALEHYALALKQNPRHRGALEYLAETYLDLGRRADADAMVARLADACDLVVMAFDNDGWKSGCEELNEVKAAYAARGLPLPRLD